MSAEVFGPARYRSAIAIYTHDHPDPDHNRTVFTAVGEPSALLAGLEELYARAVERIDLRRHDGIHPRIGAVDVCPFVPLPEHGTTMEDCVDLAGRLGRRVAERFDLPVFYYGEAARVPGRVAGPRDDARPSRQNRDR